MTVEGEPLLLPDDGTGLSVGGTTRKHCSPHHRTKPTPRSSGTGEREGGGATNVGKGTR